MSFHIVTVGNIKEKYLCDALIEYEKRLSAYVRVVKHELKEERLPRNAGEAQIAHALEKEGENMLACVPTRAYLIALCVEGKQLSSEEMSHALAQAGVNGYSDVVFFIGSSEGLSPAVKTAADLRLSFSKMTFPHQLMRVMLMEQLYRAMNLANGGKYHK